MIIIQVVNGKENLPVSLLIVKLDGSIAEVLS